MVVLKPIVVLPEELRDKLTRAMEIVRGVAGVLPDARPWELAQLADELGEAWVLLDDVISEAM